MSKVGISFVEFSGSIYSFDVSQTSENDNLTIYIKWEWMCGINYAKVPRTKIVMYASID